MSEDSEFNERRVQIGPNGEHIYPSFFTHGHLGANMHKPPSSTVLEELQIKQAQYKHLTSQIDDLEKRRAPLTNEIRQLSKLAQKEIAEALALLEKPQSAADRAIH